MVMVETVEVEPAAGPVPMPGGPLSYIHWGRGLREQLSRPQRHSS